MRKINEKIEGSKSGGVFPDGKTFQAIYEEYLDSDLPSAPESLQNAWRKMREAFDDYLAAYGEYDFRQAYLYGYKAGFEAATQKASTVA
ncbi:MAG: hypothetical protein LUI87_09450 [Lachnospiraceae bacterium]|nr:hypothetical protein [Lachnospiraceae bacterium]